jgi:uncharacterized RDD family membrane protein YckC
MYCPNCGVRLEGNPKYCSNCGTELDLPDFMETQSAGMTTTGHAGFWLRLVAWIIDAIVVVVVSFMIRLVPIPFGPLLIILIIWLYYALMESSPTRATLGKMALGIVVMDMYGNRVSFGRATGRYFGKIISTIILFIGYLMIAFTEKKQGLHDIMADTLVEVKRR